MNSAGFGALNKSNFPERESIMTDEPLNPGDVAEPGTPGTGENICPKCEGSGRIDDVECPVCGGSGKVIEGIGGA